MTPLFVNALYATGQTILFVVYAVVFFVDSELLFYAGPWARGVGLLLCAAGLLIGALAFVALRSVIQIAPQPREGAHLITGGVYAKFRHPIYTGILLIVVGLFVRRPTAFVAFATAAVIVLLVLKSAYEERLLAARYPEYPEYRRHTFGVIPLLT